MKSIVDRKSEIFSGIDTSSNVQKQIPSAFRSSGCECSRTIVDQNFSVPKCVRLARMSEKSYELPCKVFSAVPEKTKEELESLEIVIGGASCRHLMSSPCHCFVQTRWYSGRSNLVLIWDCGELLSMGSPDSSQPITIVIVGVMMAIR